VAAFAVFLVALPLYFVGFDPGLRLENTTQFSDYVARVSSSVLIRATLADPLIMAGLLIFLAGFRHLIRQARQDDEWVATLVFGAGLAVTVIRLVGDGLEGGAALDASVAADPTAVRALMEASLPMYGAIGLVMSALLLASAGYATMGTEVLPRWTAWVAYGAAILNLAAAPSILGGTNLTGFYTAPGYATNVGQAALVLWFLVASVSMLAKREAAAATVGT
jgi:hypothetical protein